MVKKKKTKEQKRRENNIILIVFIVLAITSAVVFNLPENRNDSLSEERCNVSQGYEWNDTYKTCLRESELTYCEPDQREGDVCTQQYDPVCGFKSDGGKETFSNSCFACLNDKVEFYTPGECEDENKK